jgi:magnesium chelatase family protein
MGSDEVRRFCRLDAESARFMDRASDKMKLSARSVFRVLKVARTVADHAQSEKVQLSHCAEALSYKNITAQYDARLG